MSGPKLVVRSVDTKTGEVVCHALHLAMFRPGALEVGTILVDVAEAREAREEGASELRDTMAMAVAPAMVSPVTPPAEVARRAYALADAMLVERSR